MRLFGTFSATSKTGIFQPGLIFILGLILLYFFSSNRSSLSLKKIFVQTASKLPVTFLTIPCLTIIARLLSQNLHVQELFKEASGMPGAVFYLSAVVTGFAGSFMAGSATVSNLMFGAEWAQLGQQYQLEVPLLLAAQIAGAGLGNALSVQNIAMVQAVLNEKDLGAKIIKTLWKPILLFFILTVFTAIIIGWVINQT